MLPPSAASRLLSSTLLLTSIASTCLAGALLPPFTKSKVPSSSSTPPPGRTPSPPNVEAQTNLPSLGGSRRPTVTITTTVSSAPTTTTTTIIRHKPTPDPKKPTPPSKNDNKTTNSSITPEVPRLVIYFQTTHDSSKGGTTPKPISMLPLITEKQIALTHLIICSLHVNANNTIHLNDYPPQSPLFYTLWNETQVMKSAGVKVMGMVGGAAAGSFSKQTLDAEPNSPQFERSYKLLYDVIRIYGLEGLDIDVEQPMSQYGITRLIRRLRADFGPDFIISLSPVASALDKSFGRRPPTLDGPARRRRSTDWRVNNLSGFDYHQLDATDGHLIDFYLSQFYNGWGDFSSPRTYTNIITSGKWDPLRIVAGQLTTPANGYGYVPFPILTVTISALRATFGEIGGIMGWEYFNGEPGGSSEPWRWAQEMTKILRPGLFKDLVVTREIALGLLQSWRDTILGSRSMFFTGAELEAGLGGGDDVSLLIPDVDYLGMVNA